MTSATGAKTAPDPALSVLHFADLQGSYNYLHSEGRVNLFTKMVLGELARRTRSIRALDIGCGTGIALDTTVSYCIRAAADELWGVELDKRIPQPAYISNYQ